MPDRPLSPKITSSSIHSELENFDVISQENKKEQPNILSEKRNACRTREVAWLCSRPPDFELISPFWKNMQMLSLCLAHDLMTVPFLHPSQLIAHCNNRVCLKTGQSEVTAQGQRETKANKLGHDKISQVEFVWRSLPQTRKGHATCSHDPESCWKSHFSCLRSLTVYGCFQKHGSTLEHSGICWLILWSFVILCRLCELQDVCSNIEFGQKKDKNKPEILPQRNTREKNHQIKRAENQAVSHEGE